MPQLSELAVLLDGQIIGDGCVEISGVSGLDYLQAGTITFGATEKAIQTALDSPVAAIIVPSQICELKKPGIRVANPRFAFTKVLNYFSTPITCIPGIHSTAVIGRNFLNDGCQAGPFVYIGDDVSIGKETILHPGVIIGDRVTIGAKSLIHANVVIREDCRVGNRVQINPGAVIGADGFGYVTVEGLHHKMPQIGKVVIEDDVEIGANTTIDRATVNVTLIKKGTKIDNLVQIGHNCIIGENNIICGQAGVVGSVVVEDHVTLGGRAGLINQIKVGHDSTVGSTAKVIGDLAPFSFVSGDPARPHQKQMRIQASLNRLPEMMKEIRELRRMIMELKKGYANNEGEK